MLVHRRARRQGLGVALMRAAEETARQCGKTLLVLDAVTNGDAARLYERLGWVRVGDVPNFALMPRGETCSTTYYYRNLEPEVAAARSDTSSSAKEAAVEFHIRKVTETDLPAIVDFYNQSIPAGWSTADTKPITVAELRRCLPEDVEAVLPLLQQLWPNATLDTQALHQTFGAALSTGNQVYFCAEIGDTVVGFASLSFKQNLWVGGLLAHVDELVVDTAHRGTGIGSRLLQKLEAHARERGAKRVDLDSAFHRTESHEWYRRRSYLDRAIVFSKLLETNG
jgi:ribosomal protein S18 acetylase RimI-like enzyme